MKKIFTLLISICIMLSLATVPAFAADTVKASGKCGTSATWTLYDTNNDGTGDKLVIGGSGKIYNYDGNQSANKPTPWNNYIYTIKTLVIGNGIIHIGDWAFAFLNKVTEVTIPSSVKTIGSHAFFWSRGLKTVKMSEGVETIGHNAFRFCESLQNITLPSSLKTIKDGAISACYSLKKIKIPASVTTMGEFAFSSCTALNSVTIEKGVTAIGVSAFSRCTALESITVPESVTKIKASAFESCSSLKTVKIAKSVTLIDEKAFYDCGSIEKVQYAGSKTGWDKIRIKSGNDDLLAVKITFAQKDLKITTQPKSVTVKSGRTAKVTVKATGDGLKYTWYYKDKGASRFTKSTSAKTASYSVSMTKARSGRQIYCVITDKYGNKVQTNTVTLSMQTPLKITTQPKSVTVKSGQTAKVTVKATGDGLKYTWYYKDKGASRFTKSSSVKTASYSVSMTKARANRQVYCVVTDKYGNKVTTNTVTLKMK